MPWQDLASPQPGLLQISSLPLFGAAVFEQSKAAKTLKEEPKRKKTKSKARFEASLSLANLVMNSQNAPVVKAVRNWKPLDTLAVGSLPR